MANPPHSPFDDRVEAVMRVINDHAEDTGKPGAMAAPQGTLEAPKKEASAPDGPKTAEAPKEMTAPAPPAEAPPLSAEMPKEMPKEMSKETSRETDAPKKMADAPPAGESKPEATLAAKPQGKAETRTHSPTNAKCQAAKKA